MLIGRSPAAAPGAGLLRLAGGPDARQEWERVVRASDDLAVTQLPAWLDCMVASGLYRDATRLYQTPDDRRLVLPLAGRGPGAGLGVFASWPMFWEGGLDNGGLLCAAGPVTPDDVSAVAADLSRTPGLRTTVVPSRTDAAAWQAGAPPGTDRTVDAMYSVDLAGGLAGWERTISKGERYKARKAERHGVEIEADGTGRLLPVFDRLYRASVNAWARESPMPSVLSLALTRRRYPHTTLEQIAARLGAACQVWMAWRGGEPQSGVVVLSHGPAATYYKGATDKAAVGSLGVGTLLHRRVIEAACEQGRRRYELSGSGIPSLTRFKLNLGARPVPLTSYRFERAPLTAGERSVRSGLKTVLRAHR